MNKNKIGAVLCTIIGIALIIFGIVEIIKIKDYSEVFGKLVENVHSTEYRYINYNFYVNDIQYTVTYTNGAIGIFNEEEKILYNPINPSENLLAKDNSRYSIIIVGIIFLGTAFFIRHKMKIEKYEGEENYHYKELGRYLIFFCGGILTVIFTSANFNFVDLLTTMLFPIIVVLFFMCLGVFLIKKNNQE